MDTIITLLRLFTECASIYVGYVGVTTIFAFITKSESLVDRTKSCRKPRFLIICIILLLLIPLDIVYTTLAYIPDGQYTMNAEYLAYRYEEIYDEDEQGYHENEYSYEGIAPVTIEIKSDVDYEDDGETNWGQSKTKTTYYTDYYLLSIKLDCFNNTEFFFDEEIEENEEQELEIEYDGKKYNLIITIGEISDETLEYTIDDRINDISTSKIVEHIIMMTLDLMGIIGYFIAMKVYMSSKEKGNN